MSMSLYVGQKYSDGSVHLSDEFRKGSKEFVTTEDTDNLVANPDYETFLDINMNNSNAGYIVEDILEFKIEDGMFETDVDTMLARAALALTDPDVHADKYAIRKLKSIVELCIWAKKRNHTVFYGA